MSRFLLCLVLLLSCWTSAPQAQDTRFMMLCPIDGDGTDNNSFRSRVFKMPGFFNIDLRSNGAVATGRMLCGANSLPANMSGVLQLANSFVDSISAAKKDALRQALGLSDVNELTGTTFEQMLPQLLIDLPTAKAGIWKPLRAGRDGKYKIYLGGSTPAYQQTAGIPFKDNGLFADISLGAVGAATVAVAAISRVPAKALTAMVAVVMSLLYGDPAYATTLATETFPTNGNLDGSTQVHPWSEFTGVAFTVSGNVAISTSSGTNEARLDVDLATDDMEVSATITAVTTNSEPRCGVIGRKDSTTTRTYYSAYGTFDGTAASEWRLIKRIAGASTSLGGNSTDPAVTDIVKLRDDASSHSLYVNGTEFVAPVTDSEITGNTRVGLYMQGVTASDSCSLDNVNAYDYLIPGTSFGSLRRRAM